MVTVPQIFHPLHIYPCPDLPFTTVDIFTVFSFASSRIKYHTVGIKNIYIAFSHWFLLLKKNAFLILLSLNCLIARFFPALHNVPLCGLSVCLSFHLLKNILLAFKFWQLWMKLIQTFSYRLLCGHMVSINLYKYQELNLLDVVARVWLVLYKTTKLLKRLHHSVFPPAVNESPLEGCFSSSTVFDALGVLHYEIIRF